MVGCHAPGARQETASAASALPLICTWCCRFTASDSTSATFGASHRILGSALVVLSNFGSGPPAPYFQELSSTYRHTGLSGASHSSRQRLQMQRKCFAPRTSPNNFCTLDV